MPGLRITGCDLRRLLYELCKNCEIYFNARHVTYRVPGYIIFGQLPGSSGDLFAIAHGNFAIWGLGDTLHWNVGVIEPQRAIELNSRVY